MQFNMSTIWQVSEILKSQRKACVFNNDLYVDCTEEQSQAIYRMLIEHREYGTIQLTTEGCEKGEYRFRIVP